MATTNRARPSRSRVRRRSPRRLAAAAAAAIFALSAHAQNDVVVFKNGDRLTGEIRGLDQGQLQFKSPETQTIDVRWDLVSQLTSARTYQVSLVNTQRLVGTLADGAGKNTLRVATPTGATDVPIPRVARIRLIGSRWFDRIEMSIDAGYSLAKANDVTQTNLGYNLRYRSDKSLVGLGVNASRSASEGSPASITTDSTLSWRWLLEDAVWDPVMLGQLQRNDELGIGQLSTVGAGLGRWISETSTSSSSFMGGLAYAREYDVDSSTSDNAVEGVIGLNLDWFRFGRPELDVSTSLLLFAQLAEPHSSRGNLNVDFYWKLVNDFYWNFSVYYSYYGNASPTASSTDYGITASLGWKRYPR
jgi:hypothetical protein